MHFIDEIKSLGDEQLVHELDILDEFRYADEIWLFFLIKDSDIFYLFFPYLFVIIRFSEWSNNGKRNIV